MENKNHNWNHQPDESATATDSNLEGLAVRYTAPSPGASGQQGKINSIDLWWVVDLPLLKST